MLGEKLRLKPTSRGPRPRNARGVTGRRPDPIVAERLEQGGGRGGEGLGGEAGECGLDGLSGGGGIHRRGRGVRYGTAASFTWNPIGESERQKTGVTVLLGTGRILRPVRPIRFVTSAFRIRDGCSGPGASPFLGCQAEEEVSRETSGVPFDLFVEASGRYTMEGGEIGIEDDVLITNATDEDGENSGRFVRGAGVRGCVHGCQASGSIGRGSLMAS